MKLKKDFIKPKKYYHDEPMVSVEIECRGTKTEAELGYFKSWKIAELRPSISGVNLGLRGARVKSLINFLRISIFPSEKMYTETHTHTKCTL